MEDKKEFLGTEPIGKLLFKLAVPTVIAHIVNMLYNIVGRIYIGHKKVFSQHLNITAYTKSLCCAA